MKKRRIWPVRWCFCELFCLKSMTHKVYSIHAHCMMQFHGTQRCQSNIYLYRSARSYNAVKANDKWDWQAFSCCLLHPKCKMQQNEGGCFRQIFPQSIDCFDHYITRNSHKSLVRALQLGFIRWVTGIFTPLWFKDDITYIQKSDSLIFSYFGKTVA